MKDKDNKTERYDGSKVSSGVTPSVGGTERVEVSVVSAGVTPPTTQIISSGVSKTTGSELILNNKKYKMLKVISGVGKTGEAEIFLVERDSQKYVFKYYYPAFKPKDSILIQLKGLHHDDTVDLIDYGYYKDRFFEIMEYAKGGTLLDVNDDGKFKYIPIKDINEIKQIVKETINALNFCHSKGIVHRDLKPENMFFKNSDGTDIIIGDFGISSMLDEGLSKHMTGQSRTAVYAAPELYQSIKGKSIISKEIDYYSFGISLIHIWSGEDPFGELNEISMMRIKMEGKIDIPEDIPDDLKTLIKGLITVVPAKRWSYEEVQKWLKGEYVPVHHKVVETKYGDFHFGVVKGEEIVVNDPEELAKLLEKNPTQGKKHLYKGTIQKWVEEVEQSLYVEIRGIVEDEYPADEDAGLIKAIYTLDPGKNYKTFSGVECRTAEEIGDALKEEASYYKSELAKENADLYIFLEARGNKDEADTFRKYAKTYNPERALNTIILELQGKDMVKIDNFAFPKPEDLVSADNEIKNKLVQLLLQPDSKLSIWLEHFPNLKNNIEKWKKLGRHNNITLSYAVEEKSPFHIYTDLAYSLENFKSLFAKYIQNKSDELTNPKSSFVKEAEFWLKNYQSIAYFEIIKDYFRRKYAKQE